MRFLNLKFIYFRGINQMKRMSCFLFSTNRWSRLIRNSDNKSWHRWVNSKITMGDIIGHLLNIAVTANHKTVMKKKRKVQTAQIWKTTPPTPIWKTTTTQTSKSTRKEATNNRLEKHKKIHKEMNITLMMNTKTAKWKLRTKVSKESQIIIKTKTNKSTKLFLKKKKFTMQTKSNEFAISQLDLTDIFYNVYSIRYNWLDTQQF